MADAGMTDAIPARNALRIAVVDPALPAEPGREPAAVPGAAAEPRAPWDGDLIAAGIFERFTWRICNSSASALSSTSSNE
jgi:hypothetical protein